MNYLLLHYLCPPTIVYINTIWKLPISIMSFRSKQLMLFQELVKNYGGLNMGILDILIIILILAWIGGFSLHVAGGLIHILIVIAIVLLIIRFLGNGRNGL